MTGQRKKYGIVVLLMMMFYLSAETRIDHVRLYQQEKLIFADVQTTITLNELIEQSIKNGMDLVFSYYFEIKGKGLFDLQAIATLKKDYWVSYNRTTGQFAVKNPVTFETNHVNQLSDVVRVMQRVTQFPIIPKEQLNDEAVIIKVKFELDNSKLPTFVRLESLVSDDWDIDSGWSEWAYP